MVWPLPLNPLKMIQSPGTTQALSISQSSLALTPSYHGDQNKKNHQRSTSFITYVTLIKNKSMCCRCKHWSIGTFTSHFILGEVRDQTPFCLLPIQYDTVSQCIRLRWIQDQMNEVKPVGWEIWTPVHPSLGMPCRQTDVGALRWPLWYKHAAGSGYVSLLTCFIYPIQNR